MKKIHFLETEERRSLLPSSSTRFQLLALCLPLPLFLSSQPCQASATFSRTSRRGAFCRSAGAAFSRATTKMKRRCHRRRRLMPCLSFIFSTPRSLAYLAFTSDFSARASIASRSLHQEAEHLADESFPHSMFSRVEIVVDVVGKKQRKKSTAAPLRPLLPALSSALCRRLTWPRTRPRPQVRRAPHMRKGAEKHAEK